WLAENAVTAAGALREDRNRLAPCQQVERKPLRGPITFAAPDEVHAGLCRQPTDERPVAQLLLGHEVHQPAGHLAGGRADDHRIEQRDVIRDEDECALAGNVLQAVGAKRAEEPHRHARDPRAGTVEPGAHRQAGVRRGLARARLARAGRAGARVRPATMRSTDSSTGKSPVSRTNAPGARRSGATARPESAASRRSISSRYSFARSGRSISAALRWARTMVDAVK